MNFKAIFAKKWVLIILFITILFSCIAVLWFNNKNSKDLLLNLNFDKNGGTTIKDSTGAIKDADVHYIYNHAVYMQNREPQWRDTGIERGSLLFDGCSTYIEYPSNEISIGGDSFSISVWVAPRAFEWDNPNAYENGTECLTGIVSQYNKEKNQGFILGYQRFGRLSFQIGTGESWLTLWANQARLKKYQWNLVTAVFDGKNGKMELYLNEEQIGFKELKAGTEIFPAEKEKLLVGKSSEAEQIAAGTYNMFSGLMDNLKLYSYALKKEDIIAKDIPEIAFEDIWLENILTEDIYKTQYHGGPYQHWMNEPHAPLYYNGMYHLFYQSNIVGTYWRNICWGHLVSKDMVNWTPIKEAITPTENSVVPDGVWSGGATTDINGIPLLFFTAGNDSYKQNGLISNQNIGVAYPADISDLYLTDWIIYDELAVKQLENQGRTGEFRDPHIWKENDTWFMLICSGSTETDGGNAILYKTKTLELKENGTIDMQWEYVGPIYEMENQSITYGTSWELPILLPITNKSKTISRYIFLFSPAPAGIADNKIYYFVGDFEIETGKFIPDKKYDGKPELLDYGSNVFTGPSAFIDPKSENICLFSIMQDQRTGAEEGAAGWAHCVGLTRNIWLDESGTDIKLSPINEIHDLEGNILVDLQDATLQEANNELEKVKGDLLYIQAILTANNAQKFGIQIKSNEKKDISSFTYNLKDKTISGDTKNKGSAAPTNHVSGSLLLEDGKLKMEIYIDRSLVEAFFNDTKSISMRTYSDYKSQGIQLFSDNDIHIDKLYVTEMKSIY